MQYSKKQVPNLAGVSGECCGCTACMTVCPASAISMNPDEKGFLRPAIDENRCLRCGKCLRICAFKKDSVSPDAEKPLAIYAVRAKDKDVVKESSSGGVFTVISDWVLQQDGAIASAVYDYASHTLRYLLYTDRMTRNAARGSKYIHPVLDDIYSQCVIWMKENPGKPLLFIGVGCHAAGFHEILKAEGIRQQAIVIDLICHGTPSPQLWTEYVHTLEQIYEGRAEYVAFKDKRNGWENPYAFMRIGDREIPLDHYSYWFYESFSQRQSCFQCPYTKLHRVTDLTIGDFWGVQLSLPEFYSSDGNSLVIVQTPRGAEIISAIKDKVIFAESTADTCMQPRLETPGRPNPKRKQFWRCYQTRGVSGLMKYYHEDGKVKTFAKKVLRKGKRFVHKLVGRIK